MVIFSCKKETAPNESTTKDSVIVNEFAEPLAKGDSASIILNDSTLQNDKKKVNLVETKNDKKGTIVKIVNGEHFPFTVDAEFTEKENHLIIKILRYNNPQLHATITTEQNDFNVQFSQIKLPNGQFDGPFSKEIKYKLPTKGEVWLLVNINNRAEGKTNGKFSVRVQ